ncbi:MAG: type IV secretory system conjugative DNA transfer family protein [Alphaproteobacteria bacterium]|nr:type IV secretory system conjugative DNA transfer family protein [Alphaproteobacteria bacterium]
MAEDMLDLLDDVLRGHPDRHFDRQAMPEARWMSAKTICTSPLFAYDPAKPDGKVLIGTYGSQLLGIRDDRHMLTVAGSRTGKSVAVKNNLFFYDGSVFVLDPKAEHASDTAAHRARRGQPVFVLDPFGKATGEAAAFRARFNPLAGLSLDSDTTVEDAQLIVDALVMTTGEEKDPHWNESAGAALLGFLLYVRFASDIDDDDRHLGTVRRLVTSAQRMVRREDDKWDFAMRLRVTRGVARLAAEGHQDIAETVKAAINGLYDKGREEMASVVSTMNRHTAFLEYKSMRNVLSGHDFDLADLKRKEGGVSVYLCLPASRFGSCARWLRIMINQLIVALEGIAEPPRAPVLTILDEFPVLGFMAQLQDAVGQMASFGMRLWPLLQDWSQGKALYGERWESFTANSSVTLFHGNTDVTTTEYISRRLGKTPVSTTQIGEPSRAALAEGQTGQSVSTALFDLMTPDEIARYFSRADAFKRQLVLIAGQDPMICQRVEHWDPNGPLAPHISSL